MLRRDRATLLLYGLLAVWGVFNYAFGPIVALLRDEQGVSRTLAGLHGTAFALGVLVGAAASPRLVKRLGRGRGLWVGIAGICVGLAGLCLVRALPLTLSCVFVVAASAVPLLSGVTAALTDLHGDAAAAAISEANAAACATGALAPLIIGASVAQGWTWRPGVAVVVVLFGALGLYAASRGIALPPARFSSASSSVGRLPWGYWVWFLVICLCGSVEVSLNLWAADLLRDRAGLSPGDATAAVGAVVAGMFTGRIIGARLALRLPAVPLFLGAIAVSGVGFFVLWFAVTAPVGVLGLVLCGLGIALHFPLAITQALRASEGQTDLASARSLYAMAVAFGLAPALLGLAADATSVRVAFLIVPVLLTAAATLAWRSRSRPGSPSPASSPSADPDPRATAVPQPPS